MNKFWEIDEKSTPLRVQYKQKMSTVSNVRVRVSILTQRTRLSPG